MTRTLLRRLIVMPLALFATSFLSFAYAHFALPRHLARNPVAFVEYTSPPPLWNAYQTYLINLFSNNLGDVPGRYESYGLTLSQGISASFGLLGITIIISVILGIILGMQAAKHDPPHVAPWLTVVSTAGLAMPSFYMGTLFIVGSIIYAIRSDMGELLIPMQGFGWDSHLIFPVLVLVARPIMEIAQMTANLMVGEFGKQYTMAARSIGVTWRGVRWKHVFANITAPLLVSISRSFRLLVGELILVERLFTWPGLGLLLAAVLTPSRSTAGNSPVFLDPVLLSTVITLITFIFLLSDLISSVLLQRFDPRLRAVEEGSHG